MYKLFIDNNWVNAVSGKTFDVVNPSNEKVLAKVPFGTGKDAQLAIEAAKKAFPVWKDTNAFDRAKLLKKVANRIRTDVDDFAKITTLESGKPLVESRGEWMVAADLLEWFSEEAKRTYGTVIPSSRSNKRMQVIWQAIGVVGVITAWNFPVWNLARPWGAALAAGCSLVVKPSEETPLTAMVLVKIFEEEGLPAGVINLVVGDAPAIGEVLMDSFEIRKVHFVGSTRVGKLLMDKASKTNTQLSLELGGNAPVIIFPDVNVKEIAASAVGAKFRNCGQVCISPQRFLVHKDIYEEFILEASKIIKGYVYGDGLDQTSQVGPLINKRQQDQLTRLVHEAVHSGAEILAGGEPASKKGKGFFFKPTILKNVTKDSPVFKEEIFGPLMPVTVFQTTEEAIKLANNTEYGLAAYIWTNNLNTAIKVSEAVEFGIVGINEWTPHATEAPFGGMKQSGQGSELGHDGIFEYMEKKLISIGSLS